MLFCIHLEKGFIFLRKNPYEGGKSNAETGGTVNESKNHTRLRRMQAAQLQHHEEQEKRPEQAGDEQILQILQETHASQGN